MTGPAVLTQPTASAVPPLLVVAAAHSAGASGGSSMEHTSAGGGSQTQSGAQLDALLAHLQSGAASGGATGGTAHGQAAREAAGGGGAGAARAASSSQAAAARGPGSRLAARTTSEPRPTNSYNARHQQVGGDSSCPRAWVGRRGAAALQVPAPEMLLWHFASPKAACRLTHAWGCAAWAAGAASLGKRRQGQMDQSAPRTQPGPAHPASPRRRPRRGAGLASTSGWRRCASWCRTPSAPTPPTFWRSWWPMCSACRWVLAGRWARRGGEQGLACIT